VSGGGLGWAGQWTVGTREAATVVLYKNLGGGLGGRAKLRAEAEEGQALLDLVSGSGTG
jgi:hypothetical protein